MERYPEEYLVHESPRPPRRASGPRLVPLLLSMVIGLLAGYILFHWMTYGGSDPTVSATPRAITARGELASDEQATIQLFKQSGPSVVYITTVTQRLNLYDLNIHEIPRGTGSGFIWDDAGHIVTNLHVLEGASGGRVTLSDRTEYPAELVGYSREDDLAVVRIRAPKDKLRPIPVGSSGDLQVGQKVFAIGDPFGFDQTLTTGIVSALNRTVPGQTGRRIQDAIQTDAAINPGNSGGPLLDSAGRLIGVNTAIYSPSGSYSGIGFAIPVDTVNRVVPQIIASGGRPPLDLGISTNDRASYVVGREVGVQGVLVVAVQTGSPAAKAGLRGTQSVGGEILIGDIILQVGDQRVRSREQLNNALRRYNAGDTIMLTVFRGGKTIQVAVTLEPETP